MPNEFGDERFEGYSGRWPRDEDFFARLAEASRGRTVVLTWKGNNHNTAFLLVQSRRLDFVLAEEPELPIDESAEIVSDRAISARLAGDAKRLARVVQQLRAGGAARIVLAGTPPPRRDMERYRHSGGTDASNFAALASQLGLSIDTVPFATDLFMYKVWRVAQRRIAEVAASESVEFCPVPDDALRDRSLRDEYAASGWTHANAAYGARMRDHLHEFLRAERA